MKNEHIKQLLNNFKQDNLSLDEAINNLNKLSYTDLGFAKIDHDRPKRKGVIEAVYCASKSSEAIAKIAKEMDHNDIFLGTRASKEHYDAVKKVCPDVRYNEIGKCLYWDKRKDLVKQGKIAVITAGTSDQAVAEEAALTADLLGSNVEKIYDVGVAGIHRLFDAKEKFEDANVIIAIAGMEGALPSVVSGLVNKIVIGVPTSVGYGTAFGGITPLLSMLNSCSPGLLVVNIDNGYGAAVAAHMINVMAMAHG